MKLHIDESIIQLYNQREEQNIMRDVWEYISKEQPNAVSLYDNGRCGSIAMEDLKPKLAYYMADMLAKETANKNNYFENSIGFWTKVNRRPKGNTDHKSVYLYTDKKGSEYWYTDDGVYRNSDHWGKRIASCSWYIDEENPRRTTGFIKWTDLKPKGTLYMNIKELAVSNPNYNHIDFDLVEDEDIVFTIEGFTFEKPSHHLYY